MRRINIYINDSEKVMNNHIPFSISEFCISPEAIPQEIADKILRYHIGPMLGIRSELNFPIWPSEKSGYRSPAYEKKRGRSGNSQHCFEEKGAVDWTCAPENLPKLLKALKENSVYQRVCYYPNDGFIHCDYRVITGYRRYYECESPSSQWEYKYDL